LMNRALGRSDSPLTMQYVAGIGGSVLVIVLLAGGTATGIPDLAPSLPASTLAWVLVLGLGGLSGYTHSLIVRASQKAPASILAPFQYLEIVSATILGYVIFNDFPTPSKLVGIAIIILSGLFIFWREQRA